MPRRWLGLVVAVAAVFVFWSPSPAVAQQDRGVELVTGEVESRWALVIGNAAYTDGELRNPLNDARDMAEVLREIRFDVDLREDLDHHAMEEAIRVFGRKLRRAPPETRVREPGCGWEDPVVGMRFRYVPEGKFKMGSPAGEVDLATSETLHEVELTRAFWIGETEVTQEQWRRLMGNNPSHFGDCGVDCPVERVSWFDAVAYANRLSEEAGKATCYELSGCRGTPGGGCDAGELWCSGDYVCDEVKLKDTDCDGYRLPTEAEWEYAARAGTTTPFWTGDNLTTNQANYDGNFPYADYPKGQYRRKPVEVRSFVANPWGLYEVHGNVWEWVWDWYATYSESSEDPTGPSRGTIRVARGGSWNVDARNCRAANRGGGAPNRRIAGAGFRLVRISE